MFFYLFSRICTFISWIGCFKACLLNCPIILFPRLGCYCCKVLPYHSRKRPGATLQAPFYKKGKNDKIKGGLPIFEKVGREQTSQWSVGTCSIVLIYASCTLKHEHGGRHNSAERENTKTRGWLVISTAWKHYWKGKHQHGFSSDWICGAQDRQSAHNHNREELAGPGSAQLGMPDIMWPHP